MDELNLELVKFARSLGFALCRVAPCSAPPHADEFRQWLASGNAGEMAWLGRNQDRRTDPQLVLPGAKSVIVLAMNYWQGPEKTEASPKNAPIQERERPGEMDQPKGRVARYAWNDDYHDLIEPKLRELDAFLQTRGGRQRHYVDTGPVLERDFAALAGAGWHGKSTMLIHPELGTWFFLAELLTTLELPPDAPQADRCGCCTRCIDACPTAAIVAPHKLDARRCVSYLTIELKGAIPEELRPLIGARIYGCDDCLTACPWNRFAKASHEAAFAARPAMNLTLRELLALDDEQFRTLFRRSPIKRIKRRGFLRNVCVALGNVGTPGDLPSLERAEADPEPLIAEHARWAIERIQTRHEGNIGRNPSSPVSGI